MAGKDQIRYDLLVQDALKGVVRKVLSDAARDGLVGDHHFYIAFRTDHPGARLSDRLREKYPQEMTIVLQHQFWDLGITEHSFEVGLSFSGVPERLLVPFEALTGFFDPSVKFGLKFEIQTEEAEAEPPLPAPQARPARGAGSEPVELQPKPVPARASKAKDRAGAEPARAAKPEEPAPEADGSEDAPAPGAEVVSLDAFRKKS
jgi:uncharacterized protein